MRPQARHAPLVPPLPLWASIAWLIFIVIVGLLACLMACRAPAVEPVAIVATSRPTTRPLGVWYQPTANFATWRARGATLLIGYEGQGASVSADAWCQAARTAGLHYVLQSEGAGADQAAAHFNDAACEAVQLGEDEPNQLNAGQQLPAALFAKAQALRAKTAKPLYVNLDGNRLPYESDAEVWGYCAAADWIGFDLYVCNFGHGIGDWDVTVQQQVQRLQRLAPGKRIVLFVETSDQRLSIQPWVKGTQLAAQMHGPDVDEALRELTEARQWGCTPAIFPDVIGLNFEQYDGTPAGIDGALRAVAAQP